MQRPAMTLDVRRTERPARAAAAVRRAVDRPVVVVGAIAVAAFAVAAYYSLRVNGWFVMTDELLYVKLAIGIWDGPSLSPSIHGEPYDVYNLLYPLLLAPLVGLLDMPVAFDAAHALGALLVASVTVPAYLLARSAALPRAAGYLVAALSVSVPWITMSMVLWTEAAGYAGLAWALYGMHRALAVPGARSDLLALGGVALAVFARTQFVVLVVLLPLALVLHESTYALTTGSRRAALREGLRRVLHGHRVLLGAYALIGIAALVVSARSGLGSVLGNYSVASDGDLLPSETMREAGQHLAVVGVAIGIVPPVLAGGWALVSLVAPTSRERHALAVVGVLVVAALALVVGSFTVRFSEGFQDRYFFYVAPLFFAGMAAALLDGRRSWPGVALAGVGFWAVVDSVTFEPGTGPPFFGSPAAVTWPVLDGRAYDIGRLLSIDHLAPYVAIEGATLVLTGALALALRFVRPGRALLLSVGLPVLAFTAAEMLYVFDRTPSGGPGTYVSGAPQDRRDWVDEAVRERGGGVVGLMPSPHQDFPNIAGWWDVELWNKTVRRSYSLDGSSTLTPFPSAILRLSEATGAVDASNQDADYLVTEIRDFRARLEGSVVTSDIPALGLDPHGTNKHLIRLDRPYRAAFVASELGSDGGFGEGPARIRFFPGPDRTVVRSAVVTLEASPAIDPTLPAGPQERRRYRLRLGGQTTAAGVLEPGEGRELAFTVCFPARSPVDARLDVTGNGFDRPAPGVDGPPIGIKVTSIEVGDPRPLTAGCS